MVITMGLETRTFEENNHPYTDSSSDIMSNRKLKKFTKKQDNIFLAVFFLILTFLSVEYVIKCQRCNQLWRFIDCIIKVFQKSYTKWNIKEGTDNMSFHQQFLSFSWYLGNILTLNDYMGRIYISTS